jgi:hypothetical protein
MQLLIDMCLHLEHNIKTLYSSRSLMDFYESSTVCDPFTCTQIAQSWKSQNEQHVHTYNASIYVS